jgi:hypothetical protein
VGDMQALNRSWHERNTNHAVKDVQRRIQHPISCLDSIFAKNDAKRYSEEMPSVPDYDSHNDDHRSNGT